MDCINDGQSLSKNKCRKPPGILDIAAAEAVETVECRSLGLSLLECAVGQYPYDASAGPLVLMMQASRALSFVWTQLASCSL